MTKAMDRKYYEAYDDRYRQVHGLNLQWFCESPSSIVREVIREFHISTRHKLLELGCGEGRDAIDLLDRGFDLLATDISGEAIAFCRKRWPQFAERFQTLDCVAGKLDGTFDLIYAVAVIHMLVPDEDRDGFYRFVRDHLSSKGIALICTMVMEVLNGRVTFVLRLIFSAESTKEQAEPWRLQGHPAV